MRRRVSQGHCREYFTPYFQHVRSSHCYITRAAINCYLGDVPYGVMGGEHITLTWVGSVGLKYWLICDHISMADFSPTFLSQMEELSALTPILSSHNSGKLVSSRLKPDIWIHKTSQIRKPSFHILLHHHRKKYQKSNPAFTWFLSGFDENQLQVITMLGFNLVFSWIFFWRIKITVFCLSWILEKPATSWVLGKPRNCPWFIPGFYTFTKIQIWKWFPQFWLCT